MTVGELKIILDKLPPGFAVEVGEWSHLVDEYTARLDHPIQSVEVYEDSKECILIIKDTRD